MIRVYILGCCTVVYKIVSIIVAKRLQRVMGSIIDQAQSGFIPGRQMADNILLAAELIKGYTRKNNSPRCMIKMDLRKAYDSISWEFLFSVMSEMGFPPKFVNWIRVCVTTVTFSILVNGMPMKPFAAKKGLRQGDPISPYLFAIAMEYLSRLLHNQSNAKSFHYHPRSKRVNVTHLLFADDLLLFCKADIDSVQCLMRTFNRFSKASGLEANISKSNVYVSGINMQIKEQITNYLRMEEGAFPFRYLGVPLHSKKLNSRDCRPLVDKIVGKISFWTSRLLSYAGRVQLVRSVIGGMLNFWAQIFCLPKKLLKMVENICRSYIWSGKEGLTKKAAVSWKQMGLPYNKGGLNLRDMYLWNRAAILKQLWSLACNKENLWVQWTG